MNTIQYVLHKLQKYLRPEVGYIQSRIKDIVIRHEKDKPHCQTSKFL